MLSELKKRLKAIRGQKTDVTKMTSVICFVLLCTLNRLSQLILTPLVCFIFERISALKTFLETNGTIELTKNRIDYSTNNIKARGLMLWLFVSRCLKTRCNFH